MFAKTPQRNSVLPSQSIGRRRARKLNLAFAILFGVFVAAVWGAIYFNAGIKAGIAADAAHFHIPQIAAMKSPDFSLRGGPYYTAMIPLFHFIAAKAIADQLLPPAAKFDFPLAWLAVVLAALSLAVTRNLAANKIMQGQITVFESVLVVACLLFSYYVFLPFAVYNTDSLALVMLMISFWAYRTSRYVVASVSLTLAVLFKSIYLGVVAFPLLLALVQVARDKRISRESLWAASTAVPAVACVALPYFYWGGLIPPGAARELNPIGFHAYSLLHFLSHFALISVFFLSPKFWLEFRPMPARNDLAIVAVTLLFVAGLWYFSPTNASATEGRFGSVVWKLSGYWQTGDRSIIVLLLSLAGGAALLKLFRILRHDSFALSVFLAMCVYGCSLSFMHTAYQRYAEPFTLMCLVYLFLISDRFSEKSSPTALKAVFLLYNIGVIGRAFLVS